MMQIKKRKVLIAALLVAFGVVGMVATGALVKEEKAKKEIATQQMAKKAETAKIKAALTVTLVSPERSQWPRSLMANGTIAAWQEAVIGTEIGGLRLVDVRVNVGDVVKKVTG